MKKELVDDVYKRLINEDWKGLSPYLKGGQMGICMFLALYSEYKNYKKARNLSAKMLPEVIKAADKLPNRLFDGRIGIAWGVKYLSNNEILEENEITLNIHKGVWSDYLYQSATMPIYLPEEEPVFSIGIYLIQLLNQEDSLQRYVMVERLLALIDECDRQLHCTIKDIYSAKEMPLPMLHSILFFLRKMEKEHIYPYQTQKLIESAGTIDQRIKNKELLDDYIYHVLIEKENTLYNDQTIDFYMKFLGNLGFYSLLYGYPGIFNIALKQMDKQISSFYSKATQIIKKGNISIETLCGWGFGLLTHTKQEEYEE